MSVSAYEFFCFVCERPIGEPCRDSFGSICEPRQEAKNMACPGDRIASYVLESVGDRPVR